MSEAVFVYGTLKRGGPLNCNMQLCGGRFLADATAEGVELYLLGAGYPAAVRDESHEAIATGELWLVDTLDILDAVEHNGKYYQRVKMPVEIEQGTVHAWVYLFLGGVEDEMPLVSGVYPLNQVLVQNLILEWEHHHGRPTPFDENGFEVYNIDDPSCYQDCFECPYRLTCEYNDAPDEDDWERIDKFEDFDCGGNCNACPHSMECDYYNV
jgi:gamma-glutamylcyclotransferase (GGCT)/AIG2-like uncharacterized protein YtfP